MTDARVFCNQCGHRNPEGSNFCSSCGGPLAQPQAQEDTTITFRPVEASGEVADEELTVHLEDLPEGAGLLLVKRGPNAGSKFVLDTDVVRVGRHPESEIFLDDVTVSRRHAEFFRSPAGFHVRDMDSLNGTYVNRGRIDAAPLRNGDEVQIGKFKLVYIADVRAEG